MVILGVHIFTYWPRLYMPKPSNRLSLILSSIKASSNFLWMHPFLILSLVNYHSSISTLSFLTHFCQHSKVKRPWWSWSWCRIFPSISCTSTPDELLHFNSRFDSMDHNFLHLDELLILNSKNGHYKVFLGSSFCTIC